MLRSALRYVPALALLAGTAGFGLAASSYGRWIVRSESAAAAAPFAAPFALFAVASGVSFALSAAAVCDAAERRF